MLRVNSGVVHGVCLPMRSISNLLITVRGHGLLKRWDIR